MAGSSNYYAQLNQQLNTVYLEMKKANYSKDQIRQKFATVMNKIPKERYKLFTIICTNKYFKIIWAILIISTMLFLLTYWDTFYWHISALTRITMIQILPYFDWRYLKNEQCLVPRLSLLAKEKTTHYQRSFPFNCNTCENLRKIEVFNYIDEDELIDKYIETDIPVILAKGLDHWRYDVRDFFALVANNNDFWYSQPCKLSTNIHSDSSITVGKLFEKAGLFESFFVHFQNCEKSAKRIFRNFTYRPDLLPEVYSPTVYNWMIWSRNYNNANYKKIELTEKITVFGQIHGTNHIRLVPRKNCEFVCPMLEFELNVGEYVIFTPLWDLEYRGFETGENLAAIMELRD